MAGKLLVRSYNVGCGDCIYVRIPDKGGHFHILIDCGSKEKENTGVMERSIKHLETEMLPDGSKLQSGNYIFSCQFWEICQNIFKGHLGCQPKQNIFYCDTHAPDARLSTSFALFKGNNVFVDIHADRN